MPIESTVVAPPEGASTSFHFLPTGIEPVGSPSFDDWLATGRFINKAQRAVHFWIGDWLNYGELQWGERYTQALDETTYDYQTLRNDKWVASRVAPDRRRIELTFDHHASVADLSEDDQEILLATAVREGLNRDEFRKYVKTRELPLKDQSLSRARDKATPAQAIVEGAMGLSLLFRSHYNAEFSEDEFAAIERHMATMQADYQALIVRHRDHETTDPESTGV